MPAILFGTPWWCFIHNLCQILLISEKAKVFKMHFSNLTLKGQRSFRGHGTFMTSILMVGHLYYFGSCFACSACSFCSKYIRTKTVVFVLNTLEQKLQAVECCNTREKSWHLMTSKFDPRGHPGLKFCTNASFMGHYGYTNFHPNRRGWVRRCSTWHGMTLIYVMEGGQF